MSYSKKQQDANESGSLNLGRDVQQMQTILREIQDGVQKNGESIRKTKKNIDYQQSEVDQFQKEPHVHYQDQNQSALNEQLRSKITSLENHLQKSNQTNELLYKKLHDSEQQLQEANKSMKRIHGEKSWKANQVEDLNYRFHDVSQTHAEFLKNARNHSEALQRQLDDKDRQLNQINKNVEEKNKQLSVVTVTQEKNLDKCIQQDRRIRQLEDENIQLKNQVQTGKQQNDSHTLTKKAEGTFLVEVEHLRADIKRLVSMLKQTAEFKDFAEIADDSGQMRFLKGVKAKSYIDHGAPCKCKVMRPCVEDEIVDERNLWCPEDAWKFAHDFRLNYDGELTETLIEKLLYEFSKIWSKREQRMIARVKANCAHEAASLRRQLAYNPKYDEHQAKATIARLKKQLKDSYRENREIHADRYSKNPPGVKWVAETVKMARTQTKEIKRAQDQNRLLREKLHDVEKLKFQDNSEKTLFMEGASWMARNLKKDGEKVMKDWRQIASKAQDPQLSEMDQILHGYNSKIGSYSSNCQKEMLLASQQAAKINRPASSGGFVNDGF